MNIAEIFLTTVNRSITAGIVILAVLPVRELLGRLNVPRRFIYLLWLIPALRLLCPVSLSSAMSLFNLPVFDRAAQTKEGMVYLPEELADLTRPGEQSGSETGGVQTGSYGMGAVRRDIGEPANYYGGRVFELPQQSQEGGPGNPAAAEKRSAPVDLRRAALQGLTVIWLAGAAALAFWQLYAYGRIRRQVACAVLLPGHRGGNIYECENISTPFTMGPLHGRIYIPCHMEKEELEYVLLHEQYHIRSHDLWVRLLACALQVIYWYNPLIWVGVCCMERDMEMRCDEHVLEQMGEDIRYNYSLSLLSYAAGRRCQPMDVTTFGESGTGKRVSHVLKYRKTGICIVILAVIAIAAVSAVCLTDRKPDGENRDSEASAEKTYFWGQQEFKIDFPEESVVPAMFLAGRSVISLESENEAGSYGSGINCVGKHCFFLVRPFYTDEDTAYELQVFDGDRKEWSSGFLEMELLEHGYIYNMFAVSDEELVYQIPVLNDDREYEAYYAVHMNRAGEELKRVDLLPACQELDMVQDQALPSEICVDNQGNYYILSFDGKQMAVLDSEGGQIASRDSSIRLKRVVPWMTAGPDGGILIQGYHEENGMEWLWLKGAQEKSLGTAKKIGFADRMIPMENGAYCYVTGDKEIYLGDAATGIMEFLYDAGSIIGNWGEVAVNGEGELLLFKVKKDSAVAYVLSRTGETHMGEGGQTIAVTDPLYATSVTRFSLYNGLEETLPKFMADYPEYAFDLKMVGDEERGAAHDRVWNELIAGEGPDLFAIDMEDLPALWEKGVLMDLRELISQETLDQIYPGLLATGTIDGCLAGVSTYYNFHSLVTSTDVWSEEELTVEDMVSLLEAGEYPHAVHRGFAYSTDSSLLYMLACYNMADSPFIDWDAGTCDFDSDLFIRLLEASKKYGNDSSVEVENRDMFEAGYTELLNGDCIAVQDILCDRVQFVRIEQLLGERYNRIGIPNADGSGQLVDPISFIVVNKNCKNKEAVAAYLEFVLGPKNISNYRRDCRDSFQVKRDWEGRWCVVEETMDGTYAYYYPLDKNDPAIRGEEMPQFFVEYLECCEDYYELMESLDSQMSTDRQIADIISEEAQSFFEGSQSAEHVAGVIQNRVQIYLSERQ